MYGLFVAIKPILIHSYRVLGKGPPRDLRAPDFPCQEKGFLTVVSKSASKSEVAKVVITAR